MNKKEIEEQVIKMAKETGKIGINCNDFCGYPHLAAAGWEAPNGTDASTREEQIEEMANIIKAVKYEPFNDGKPTYTVGNQMQDFVFSLIAEELLKYYQPKLPEDSVVLSREELSKEPYNDFCKGCPNVRVRSSGMTDCCADYSCKQFQKYARLIELYEQSRKETAEKILNSLLFEVKALDDYESVGKFDILGWLEELANKYGVEVEK